MGGHGVHVEGNKNNVQETDEEMLGKIQMIDTIKHNPNHFHMEALNPANMYTILGGAHSMVYGGLGALVSFAYYNGQRSSNFYAHNMRSFGRLSFGLVVGLSIGYLKFGDRQRLHNAYVAERLRRRYPESMNLSTHAGDLWQFKGVVAPQDFYKWV